MIDVFTKYAWVKFLKVKIARTVLHRFGERVNEYNRKPSKLWVDQGREFQNSPLQKWLNDNEISALLIMKVTRNFLRMMKTLKGRIYDNLTVNDNRSYLGCLNKLVDEIILIIVLLVKSLLMLAILFD